MMSLKRIHQNIAEIRQSGQAWNALVHDTAVGVVERAAKHGDCTAALALVNALSNTARKSILITWFATYSPITMNVKKGLCRLNKGPKATKFDVAGAKANPWHTHADKKPEALPDTTLEDFREQIDRLADRILGRADRGKVAANDKGRIVALAKELKLFAVRKPTPVRKPRAPKLKKAAEPQKAAA